MDRAAKEREMLAAVLAYQKDTAKIAKSIARATIDAVNELSNDAEHIFATFLRKAGVTREEALAFLRTPITKSVRDMLIRRARRTYRGKRLEQELVRLSGPSYKHRMDNAEALKASAKMNGDALYETIKAKMTDGVDAVTKEATARTQYSVQKEAGVVIDWAQPNEPQLRATHEEIGVYHKVKLFSVEELEQARTRISAGILDGESYESISRKVAADTGKEMYKARRLVRTTMAQAASDAEAKTLKDLGIDKYEIMCVLDEKTCPICGKYDGKIFRLDNPNAPRPTFHPNCRCSIKQVLSDEVKDKLTRAARDRNGKTIQVPSRMTYGEWKAKYGPKSVVPEPPHKRV